VEVYHVLGMQVRFQLVHDCMPTCIYWKYKPQPVSIVQEFITRRLVLDIVQGDGEVPEIKWVQINSIHSTQYTSTTAYLPDPPDFSKGLVPRLGTRLDIYSFNPSLHIKLFDLAYVLSSHCAYINLYGRKTYIIQSHFSGRSEGYSRLGDAVGAAHKTRDK